MENYCSNQLVIIAKPEVVEYIKNMNCSESEGGFHIAGNMTPECAYNISPCIDERGDPTGMMMFEVPFFGTRDLPPMMMYETILKDLQEQFPDQKDEIEMRGRYQLPRTDEWLNCKLSPAENLSDVTRSESKFIQDCGNDDVLTQQNDGAIKTPSLGS